MVLHKAESTAIGAAIKTLLRRLGLESAQTAINRMYEEQVKEIALEWPRHVERLQQDFAEQGRDLQVEIAEKVDERAATILFARMLEEAIESPTRERLSLMCGAMTGVINPDLDVETKSRVARAVAMLEPSDVILLRRMVDAKTDHAIGGLAAEQRLEAEALQLAGCIRLGDDGVGFLSSVHQKEENARLSLPTLGQVTLLGSAVLRQIGTWQP
jgi:hypothetical protein